jgi:8-oxo-dGTP diphosphatase
MASSQRSSIDNHSQVIPVAVALVADNGRFLVGRRGPDRPLAGYFEFPGGKCRPGEPPEVCVVRECHEETGLAIEVVRLRSRIIHTYPYGTVHLHFFDCRIAPQQVQNAQTGNFIWVAAEQLRDLTFPEPNGPLIAELLREHE